MLFFGLDYDVIAILNVIPIVNLLTAKITFVSLDGFWLPLFIKIYPYTNLDKLQIVIPGGSPLLILELPDSNTLASQTQDLLILVIFK